MAVRPLVNAESLQLVSLSPGIHGASRLVKDDDLRLPHKKARAGALAIRLPLRLVPSDKTIFL